MGEIVTTKELLVERPGRDGVSLVQMPLVAAVLDVDGNRLFTLPPWVWELPEDRLAMLVRQVAHEVERWERIGCQIGRKQLQREFADLMGVGRTTDAD